MIVTSFFQEEVCVQRFEGKVLLMVSFLLIIVLGR